MSMSDYKTQLEAELLRVEEALKTIATLDESNGDWVAVPDAEERAEADENSEADGVEEWNERRATVASLETAYNNTKQALQKLEIGTFGICEICSNPIEADRLAVIPTARTCKEHRDDERTLTL
jgi:DnaK suppressor protein